MQDVDFLSELTQCHSKVFFPLDTLIPDDSYVSIDLSIQNKALDEIDLSDPYKMDDYITAYLKNHDARVAYGGYNETRNLYKSSTIFFSGAEARSIHLGVDFWAPAGTVVRAALSGHVHSFQNNQSKGDYGPTIILAHELKNIRFYTLYGHLSLSSLDSLFVGKEIKTGDQLATLGTPEENVHYAPHLHFQIIRDLQGKKGDYPGVCAKNERPFYLKNCPDPCVLLKYS